MRKFLFFTTFFFSFLIFAQSYNFDYKLTYKRLWDNTFSEWYINSVDGNLLQINDNSAYLSETTSQNKHLIHDFRIINDNFIYNLSTDYSLLSPEFLPGNIEINKTSQENVYILNCFEKNNSKKPKLILEFKVRPVSQHFQNYLVIDFNKNISDKINAEINSFLRGQNIIIEEYTTIYKGNGRYTYQLIDVENKKISLELPTTLTTKIIKP